MQYVFNFIVFMVIAMAVFGLGDWMYSRETNIAWIMLVGYIGLTLAINIADHYFPIFK